MSYQLLKRSGILTYQLGSPREVYQFAYPLLRNKVDKKTLLLISGGEDVLKLYELISQFATIVPGAVVMVDEVFGLPFHYKSYELDIRETNIIDHFSKKGVPFFRILSRSASAEGTVRLYQGHLEQLYDNFARKVAILQLHANGRIAGLIPNRDNWANPALSEGSQLTAAFVDLDQPEDMQQIVTLTQPALEKVDEFLVLATGKEKSKAIKMLFESDKRRFTRVPATFLQNRASVVHLLTDQTS